MTYVDALAFGRPHRQVEGGQTHGKAGQTEPLTRGTDQSRKDWRFDGRRAGAETNSYRGHGVSGRSRGQVGGECAFSGWSPPPS